MFLNLRPVKQLRLISAVEEKKLIVIFQFFVSQPADKNQIALRGNPTKRSSSGIKHKSAAFLTR